MRPSGTIHLLLVLSLAGLASGASSACISFQLDDSAPLESAHVNEQDGPVQIYQIEFDSESTGNLTGRRVDFLKDTVDFNQCPSTCLSSIAAFNDNSQDVDHSTILHFSLDQSGYLPPNYQLNRDLPKFFCGKVFGFCGATVPVYRYYKLTEKGVYHAYSFGPSQLFPNYTQESFPICYAWAPPAFSPSFEPSNPLLSEQPSQNCGSGLSVDGISPLLLSDLNVFFNNLTYTLADHYFSTRPDTSSQLQGYTKGESIGKVLTFDDPACGCLVQLRQMYDNQNFTKPGRIDHKLAPLSEMNRANENYMPTGEKIYCAKRLGDCGATLPLWKQYNYYTVDSMLTTDSKLLPYSFLYPPGVLCYIWAPDYNGFFATQAAATTLAPTTSNETILVGEIAGTAPTSGNPSEVSTATPATSSTDQTAGTAPTSGTPSEDSTATSSTDQTAGTALTSETPSGDSTVTAATTIPEQTAGTSPTSGVSLEVLTATPPTEGTTGWTTLLSNESSPTAETLPGILATVGTSPIDGTTALPEILTTPADGEATTPSTGLTVGTSPTGTMPSIDQTTWATTPVIYFTEGSIGTAPTAELFATGSPLFVGTTTSLSDIGTAWTNSETTSTGGTAGTSEPFATGAPLFGVTEGPLSGTTLTGETVGTFGTTFATIGVFGTSETTTSSLNEMTGTSSAIGKIETFETTPSLSSVPFTTSVWRTSPESSTVPAWGSSSQPTLLDLRPSELPPTSFLENFTETSSTSPTFTPKPSQNSSNSTFISDQPVLTWYDILFATASPSRPTRDLFESSNDSESSTAAPAVAPQLIRDAESIETTTVKFENQVQDILNNTGQWISSYNASGLSEFLNNTGITISQLNGSRFAEFLNSTGNAMIGLNATELDGFLNLNASEISSFLNSTGKTIGSLTASDIQTFLNVSGNTISHLNASEVQNFFNNTGNAISNFNVSQAWDYLNKTGTAMSNISTADVQNFFNNTGNAIANFNGSSISNFSNSTGIGNISTTDVQNFLNNTGTAISNFNASEVHNFLNNTGNAIHNFNTSSISNFFDNTGNAIKNFSGTDVQNFLNNTGSTITNFNTSSISNFFDNTGNAIKNFSGTDVQNFLNNTGSTITNFNTSSISNFFDNAGNALSDPKNITIFDQTKNFFSGWFGSTSEQNQTQVTAQEDKEKSKNSIFGELLDTFTPPKMILFWVAVSFPVIILGQNCPMGNGFTAAEMSEISVYQIKNTRGHYPKYRISTKHLHHHSKIVGDETAHVPLAELNSTFCPDSCLWSLTAYEDPTSVSILHERSPFPAFIPNGYKLTHPTNISCSPIQNRCGATVPLYRYYRITDTGIHHTYSFHDSTEYPGFVRESSPLCFVWPHPEVNRSVLYYQASPTNQVSLPKCQKSISMVNSSFQTPLRVYYNYYNGPTNTLRDHFTTTLPSTNSQLKGYQLQSTLGWVLTKSSVNCDCLVHLSQLVDSQDSVLVRLDHKLIIDGFEPNQPLEQYRRTGEGLYCSAEQGKCGATIPLYKQFDILNIDTQYTTTPTLLPNSVFSPSNRPICFIWPVREQKKSQASVVHVAPPQNLSATETLSQLKAPSGPSGNISRAHRSSRNLHDSKKHNSTLAGSGKSSHTSELGEKIYSSNHGDKTSTISPERIEALRNSNHGVRYFGGSHASHPYPNKSGATIGTSEDINVGEVITSSSKAMEALGTTTSSPQSPPERSEIAESTTGSPELSGRNQVSASTPQQNIHTATSPNNTSERVVFTGTTKPLPGPSTFSESTTELFSTTSVSVERSETHGTSTSPPEITDSVTGATSTATEITETTGSTTSSLDILETFSTISASPGTSQSTTSSPTVHAETSETPTSSPDDNTGTSSTSTAYSATSQTTSSPLEASEVTDSSTGTFRTTTSSSFESYSGRSADPGSPTEISITGTPSLETTETTTFIPDSGTTSRLSTETSEFQNAQNSSAARAPTKFLGTAIETPDSNFSSQSFSESSTQTSSSATSTSEATESKARDTERFTEPSQSSDSTTGTPYLDTTTSEATMSTETNGVTISSPESSLDPSRTSDSSTTTSSVIRASPEVPESIKTTGARENLTVSSQFSDNTTGAPYLATTRSKATESPETAGVTAVSTGSSLHPSRTFDSSNETSSIITASPEVPEFIETRGLTESFTESSQFTDSTTDAPYLAITPSEATESTETAGVTIVSSESSLDPSRTSDTPSETLNTITASPGVPKSTETTGARESSLTPLQKHDTTTAAPLKTTSLRPEPQKPSPESSEKPNSTTQTLIISKTPSEDFDPTDDFGTPSKLSERLQLLKPIWVIPTSDGYIEEESATGSSPLLMYKVLFI
ncbi:unnamed protein product [Caenorhabditis auriculariae]|uniref:Uncharacterized protein n=1 Tax=Caenorhabditis auriculariae TaxID=2777116 RepID=A0A8S1H1Z9_9PELO|nr:unnamed protein product [Caenorhabditis auriculariae]